MQYFYLKLPVLHFRKGNNKKKPKEKPCPCKNKKFKILTFQWGKINTLHVISNKGGILFRWTAMATLCLSSILQAKPMPKKPWRSIVQLQACVTKTAEINAVKLKSLCWQGKCRRKAGKINMGLQQMLEFIYILMMATALIGTCRRCQAQRACPADPDCQHSVAAIWIFIIMKHLYQRLNSTPQLSFGYSAYLFQDMYSRWIEF